MTRSATIYVQASLTRLHLPQCRHNVVLGQVRCGPLTTGVPPFKKKKKRKSISIGNQQCLPHLYRSGPLLSDFDNPMRKTVLISLFTYITATGTKRKLNGFGLVWSGSNVRGNRRLAWFIQLETFYWYDTSYLWVLGLHPLQFHPLSSQ